MQKTITITVPDEFVSDLEEAAREDGCSEEEVILNAIKRRIAGSKIHTVEELKAAFAEEAADRAKQTP